MRSKYTLLSAFCGLLTYSAIAAADDGSVLPFPPTPSASKAGPTLAGIHPQAPRRTEPSAEGRAERAHRADRRRRLRRAGYLWRLRPHADAFAAARRRHQLQSLSHHLDLLAHARGAAHRAQSPARRQRHHRRARGGLGRLHGRHAEDLRDDRRGAEELRLQDLRLRQMAQHARRPDHGDGAVHLLAHRLRLRVLLRLPRGRNLAVGAAPRGKHHRHRAAARREISPHRGHGGQGHHLAEEASRLLPGQTVLHVLGARRRPRTASRHRSSGPTNTKASSTRAGTSSARRSSPARKRSAGFPPTPNSRRATRPCRRGQTFPNPSAPSRRA